jgi:hypothetical protein
VIGAVRKALTVRGAGGLLPQADSPMGRGGDPSKEARIISRFGAYRRDNDVGAGSRRGTERRKGSGVAMLRTL